MDPKSHAKPHFTEEPALLSTGLDLSQYLQYKGHEPAARKPAGSQSDKTLTEVELVEARAALHAAAEGGTLVTLLVTLPEGIHERLFRAIAG